MQLLDMLPYRLGIDPYIADFQRGLQSQVDNLSAAYDRMIKNLTVSGAEEWIGLWETAYGLTGTGTLDARRGAVKAKMRGAATTTEELIRSVADGYSDEPSELVVDNPAYSFYLYIYSNDGSAPENLDNLKRVIEEIKPAHLAFEIYLQVDAAYQGLFAAGMVETTAEYLF